MLDFLSSGLLKYYNFLLFSFFEVCRVNFAAVMVLVKFCGNSILVANSGTDQLMCCSSLNLFLTLMLFLVIVCKVDGINCRIHC